MIYFLCKVYLIIIIVRGEKLEDSTVPRTIAVDYSQLANEAEHHKYNILNFLNETRVQQIYKMLFKTLLQQLLGNLYKSIS